MVMKSILDKAEKTDDRINKITCAIEIFYHLSNFPGLIQQNTKFHDTIAGKITEYKKEIKNSRLKLLVQEKEFYPQDSTTVRSIITLAKEVALLDHLDMILDRMIPLL